MVPQGEMRSRRGRRRRRRIGRGGGGVPGLTVTPVHQLTFPPPNTSLLSISPNVNKLCVRVRVCTRAGMCGCVYVRERHAVTSVALSLITSHLHSSDWGRSNVKSLIHLRWVTGITFLIVRIHILASSARFDLIHFPKIKKLNC